MPSPPPSPPPVATTLNRNMVILHVENDHDDVFLTQRAFRKAGVNNPIAAVENGEQAVAYLQGEGKYAQRHDYPLPAVILLDWNMPLMPGRAFLAWLRRQLGLRRLPVVVLTSSSNPQDMVEAYDLGANGFIVKPGTQQAFVEMTQAFASYWLRWNRSDAALAAGWE